MNPISSYDLSHFLFIMGSLIDACLNTIDHSLFISLSRNQHASLANRRRQKLLLLNTRTASNLLRVRMLKTND